MTEVDEGHQFPKWSLGRTNLNNQRTVRTYTQDVDDGWLLLDDDPYESSDLALGNCSSIGHLRE